MGIKDTKNFPHRGKVAFDNGQVIYKTTDGIVWHQDINQVISWKDASKTVGNYEVENTCYVFSNKIYCNPEIDRHVTFLFNFRNRDYAVQRTVTAETTTTLLSVSYE